MDGWLDVILNAEPRTPEKAAPARLDLVNSPRFRETYVLLEFKRICDKPIPGIYIQPSDNTVFEWFGVVFVDSGLWAGSAFHFSILVPEEYPSVAPTIRFDNLVDPGMKDKRAWSVERLDPTLSPWDPSRHTIRSAVRAIPSYFSHLGEHNKRTHDIDRAIEKSTLVLPEICHMRYSSIHFGPPHPDHDVLATTLCDPTTEGRTAAELLTMLNEQKRDVLTLSPAVPYQFAKPRPIEPKQSQDADEKFTSLFRRKKK